MGNRVWLIEQGELVAAEVLGESSGLLALQIGERLLVRPRSVCFTDPAAAISDAVASLNLRIAALEMERNRITLQRPRI